MDLYLLDEMIRDSVLVILPLGGSLSKNVSMLSISSSVVGVTASGCSWGENKKREKHQQGLWVRSWQTCLCIFLFRTALFHTLDVSTILGDFSCYPLWFILIVCGRLWLHSWALTTQMHFFLYVNVKWPWDYSYREYTIIYKVRRVYLYSTLQQQGNLKCFT